MKAFWLKREIDYCKNSLIIRKIFFLENIFGEKFFLKKYFLVFGAYEKSIIYIQIVLNLKLRKCLD
jgi:hypothetical protein